MCRLNLFLGILISFLVITGCEETTPVIIEAEEPDLRGLQLSEMQEAIYTFGGELFKTLVDQKNEAKNMVISPLSIATALYMTYNGANNDTRTAMAKTLNFEDIHPDSLNSIYSLLFKQIQPQNDSVLIKLANAVFWDQDRMFPSDQFKSALEMNYDAELKTEDFQNDPEGTLETINAWVNEKTEGKIEKILENLDPMEVMFLVNALYFIGSWDHPFDPLLTYDGPYTLGNGNEIITSYMSHRKQWKTFQREGYQAIESPFTDTAFAMYFILPTEGRPINDFVQSFDFQDFFKFRNDRIERNYLDVSIPKFELNYKVTLNDELKTLGMDIAFDPYLADFSNIGEVAYGNAYISRVEHKTYLKIDETGAEGAAVTGVGIAITSAPPTLKFNRPFMTILMHKGINIPIFIGKIENPNE